MQKITPHFWFAYQAEEAASFYTSIFNNSKIVNKTHYGKAGFKIHKQPEGKVMTVEFKLEGQNFVVLNGGPLFTFNPSVSFLVNCQTSEEVEILWNKLSEKAKVLMDLGEYPFSKKYGWLQDKYGLSWQIMLSDTEVQQKIIPTMMFVGDVAGKTEEAINLYTAVFKDSKIGYIMRYEKNQEPDKEGTVKHAGFTIERQEFAAMDSAYKHNFSFNEAISFLVRCENQQEIDFLWEKLTLEGDPNAQQCGWLQDKYGLSWQIVPSSLDIMMKDLNKDKVARVTNAFLKMKKMDMNVLQKVYDGK